MGWRAVETMTVDERRREAEQVRGSIREIRSEQAVDKLNAARKRSRYGVERPEVLRERIARDDETIARFERRLCELEGRAT